MNISRALVKTLTSPSQSTRLLPPLTIFQSTLYSTSSSTTTKPRLTAKKRVKPTEQPESTQQPEQTQQPNSPPPPSPPPPPSRAPLSSVSSQHTNEDNFPNYAASGIIESVWKRPSEIPWQAKIANSVDLIGFVAMPVQHQKSSDGKFWAGTVLTQEQAPDTALWIPLIFEGDLAQTVAFHLKEKDLVHVTGQLSGDPSQFVMKHGQSSIQVMVQNINFVKDSHVGTRSHTSSNQVGQSFKFSDLAKHRALSNNGLNKSNQTGLYFDPKDDGRLIATDELSKSDSLSSTHETTQKSGKSGKDFTEDSWKDLVDNPSHWSDHRKKKLSGQLKPNYPDFKHKDNAQALWLNRAPHWVLSKLEGAPNNTVHIPVQRKIKNVEDSWKSVVDNPDEWWDNRSNKRNPRGPDFVHKTTREALWLDTLPVPWKSMLPPMES